MKLAARRFAALMAIGISSALVAGCGQPPIADGTSMADPAQQVAIGGAVDRPGSLSLAELKALPSVTQTVQYGLGGARQTRTFTGADLWILLESKGIQTDAAVKSDLLRKYVVATGSDGYRAAFSLAELKSDFGNRGSLVAYAEVKDGAAVPFGSAGIRVTAPGDARGGRYVSGLVRLDVRSATSTKTASGGGPSTWLEVSGAVLRPATFDLVALQALPVTEHKIGKNVFRGVSLWDLLNTTAGLALDPKVKGDALARYVVATATDGYQAVFALGELDPAFGAQPNLVAYEIDGAALGSKGFVRLVVPNDIKPGRWVTNLVSLQVFATP